jgi:hypothetical protein
MTCRAAALVLFLALQAPSGRCWGPAGGEIPTLGVLWTSLAHPGGNMTGLTLIGGESAVKRLELLREKVPRSRLLRADQVIE